MFKLFLMMIVATMLFSSCHMDDRIMAQTIRNRTKIYVNAEKGLHKVGDTIMMENDVYGRWSILYDDNVPKDTVIYSTNGAYRTVYRKAIVREVH